MSFRSKYQCSQRKERQVKKMTQTRLSWYKSAKNQKSINLTIAESSKGSKPPKKETRLQDKEIKHHGQQAKTKGRASRIRGKANRTKRTSSKATSKKHRLRKAKRAVNMLNGKVVVIIRSSKILALLQEVSIRRLRR